MASFALDLREYVTKVKGKLDDVTRSAITDVASRCIEASPVGDPATWKSPPPPGYVGGKFRGSWDLSLDTPSTALYRTIDPTGEASKGRIVAAIPEQASGRMYYICNNTPYAMRLENGWSYMQAPLGIVNLVVFDWQKIVSEAVNKVKAS